MNKNQFFDQVSMLASQYDQDNQWFGFSRGGPVWSQGSWIQFILAAWKLYDNTRNNQLQMILLGDTKIRSDSGLLFNFGLAANNTSPQEKEDRKMVEDLMNKRRNIAGGASSKGAVEMMGPGSILSAVRWSPMLNDALMLAGIIAGQDFHFALNDDEQKAWGRILLDPVISAAIRKKPAIVGVGTSELEKRRAMFGQAVTAKRYSLEQEIWLKFFQTVPRVFWENGNPRVFVRELLGLKLFGYKPVFTLNELGFIPGSGGNIPTFQNYLIGLRNAGLDTRNRTSLMRELSEFLFNDPNALKNIGA